MHLSISCINTCSFFNPHYHHHQPDNQHTQQLVNIFIIVRTVTKQKTRNIYSNEMKEKNIQPLMFFTFHFPPASRRTCSYQPLILLHDTKYTNRPGAVNNRYMPKALRGDATFYYGGMCTTLLCCIVFKTPEQGTCLFLSAWKWNCSDFYPYRTKILSSSCSFSTFPSLLSVRHQ